MPYTYEANKNSATDRSAATSERALLNPVYRTYTIPCPLYIAKHAASSSHGNLRLKLAQRSTVKAGRKGGTPSRNAAVKTLSVAMP